MSEEKTLKALYATVNQLEYQLAQLGDDLSFQVKPGGGLEIVRRAKGELAEEPKQVVAQLRGADPLLWQIERPEGGLVLGQAYRTAAPRCAQSDRDLPCGAPVDLYLRGQPVDLKHAFAASPRLTLLHGLATTLDALLRELWSRSPGAVARAEAARAEAGGEKESAENPIAAQVRDWFRDLDRGRHEPQPRDKDIPEEN